MSEPRTKIDPEQFRRKVGQANERWYIDPLPTCDLAIEDLEWQAPSVSAVKSASGKDWTQVSLQRAGHWLADTRPDLANLEGQAIAQLLTTGSGAGLDSASIRGNEIHRMFEVYADGGDPTQVELQVEAAAFRNTVLRLLRDVRPVVVHSEFVCISRTVGYGGTADAIWEINGGLWMVDYKSRAGKPAVYLEEGWQMAAYANCDYAIDIDPDTGCPRRFQLPKLQGGLIVSITPLEYAMRPANLDKAYEGFLALHGLWTHKHAGITPVFAKVWPNPKPTRDHWLRDQIDAVRAIDITPLLTVWPEGVPTPKHVDVYDDDQIDLIIPALHKAQAVVSAPWPETDPGRSTPVDQRIPGDDKVEPPVALEPLLHEHLVDEGDLMPSAVVTITHRYSLLSTSQQGWINARVAEAYEFGQPIKIDVPYARRVFIARALVLAAEKGMSESTFGAMVCGILDMNTEILDTGPLGMWLSLLGWEQAATLAAMVQIAAPHTEQPPTETAPAVEETKPSKAKAPTRKRKAT